MRTVLSEWSGVLTSKKDFEAPRLDVFATTRSPPTPLLTAEFGLSVQPMPRLRCEKRLLVALK